MPYSQKFEDDVVMLNELFESLARRFLRIPTLKMQYQDSKDFHEVNVNDVRSALQEAYLKGYEDGTKVD
jgi:hypothetical protein